MVTTTATNRSTFKKLQAGGDFGVALPLRILIAAIVTVMVAVQIRAIAGGPSLRVEWDGFGGNLNFRDVGASVNHCLQADNPSTPVLMQIGRLTRSNHKFSGFGCHRIGNPEVIFSLNHDPKRPVEYFCSSIGHIKVGQHFNSHVELSDLEFFASWDDPKMRADACGFFRESFKAMADGRRTHVHCEAGRDRTGAFAALVTALIAEHQSRLDRNMLNAIECDYRASRSIKPYKYGRMEAFVTGMMARGGVAVFLQSTCNVPSETLTKAIAYLSAPPSTDRSMHEIQK